jgi:hypothetical protein
MLARCAKEGMIVLYVVRLFSVGSHLGGVVRLDLDVEEFIFWKMKKI